MLLIVACVFMESQSRVAYKVLLIKKRVVPVTLSSVNLGICKTIKLQSKETIKFPSVEFFQDN